MSEQIVVQTSNEEILWLALAAIGAAVAAAISALQTFLTRRQLTASKKAMELEITLRMMERLLSPIHELTPSVSDLPKTIGSLLKQNPNATFYDIPNEYQNLVSKLTAAYEEVGMYLFYGHADEDKIITMVGDSALSAWNMLEPIIKNTRHTEETIMVYFEYIANKVREKPVKKRLEEAGFYKKMKS